MTKKKKTLSSAEITETALFYVPGLPLHNRQYIVLIIDCV